MDAAGRVFAWIGLMTLAYVTLRGSLPRYLSLLGI